MVSYLVRKYLPNFLVMVIQFIICCFVALYLFLHWYDWSHYFKVLTVVCKIGLKWRDGRASEIYPVWIQFFYSHENKYRNKLRKHPCKKRKKIKKKYQIVGLFLRNIKLRFLYPQLNPQKSWKQHGGCAVRRINRMTSQQRASPDAGWKNPMSQRPGSNSSVRKLLLLIHKFGVYWWGK